MNRAVGRDIWEATGKDVDEIRVKPSASADEGRGCIE